MTEAKWDENESPRYQYLPADQLPTSLAGLTMGGAGEYEPGKGLFWI